MALIFSRRCVSCVGGIVGAWLLGVRDRHFDNVLLRESDGAVVHIDFGYAEL